MPTRDLPKTVNPNPEVLRWAVDQVDDPDDLGVRAEWLDGSKLPTYRQLQEVARRLDIPFATFFLTEPPPQAPIPVDFRARLEAHGAAISRQTFREVQRLFRLQERLRELSILPDPTRLTVLRAGASRMTSEELAREVRTELGITVDQQLATTSPHDALNLWKDAIEGLGLFVVQISLAADSGLSGLALVDSGPPSLVALRAKDGPEVRQFTLAHELFHVLKGTSSVVSPDELFTIGRNQLEETKANRFAAELLLPGNIPQLRQRFETFDGTRNWVSELARSLRLSYTFILFRTKTMLGLRDGQIAGLLPRIGLETPGDDADESGGGDFYRNTSSRVGKTLARAIWKRLDAGALEPADACEVLRVKVEQLERLRDLTE